ncbi:predicted protein [Chaetoceros tenuissimus]|uniref:Uncharacterized protein n=1 Tax=Chaetoceros tenuissimus TaxID=426638 RepID=A0AAD3DFI6_9STRA|nr:predicted protein [Chaetoceros tenuissimus]
MADIGYPFEEIIRDTTLEEVEEESVKIKEEERTLEYKRNLEKVLDECTERYNTQPEKLRKIYDEMFDVQLRNLANFHRKYGTWDVPSRGKYAHLYHWSRFIREIFRRAYYDGQLYYNKTLPRHRYEKLLEIGFPFVEHKKVHEDDENSISSDKMPTLVSARANIKTEDEARYNRNLDKVLNEDTARYDCLPKSRKDIYDKQFDENLQRLVSFHDKYGNRDPFDRKLNQWLKHICRSYNYAYYNGQQRRIQLPRHRYEKRSYRELLRKVKIPKEKSVKSEVEKAKKRKIYRVIFDLLQKNKSKR